MKAPYPVTLAEALCLAHAIRETVGVQRWAWSEALVRATWAFGAAKAFQHLIDADWENRWTDEECAAITVLYRLTK